MHGKTVKALSAGYGHGGGGGCVVGARQERFSQRANWWAAVGRRMRHVLRRGKLRKRPELEFQPEYRRKTHTHTHSRSSSSRRNENNGIAAATCEQRQTEVTFAPARTTQRTLPTAAVVAHFAKSIK